MAADPALVQMACLARDQGESPDQFLQVGEKTQAGSTRMRGEGRKMKRRAWLRQWQRLAGAVPLVWLVRSLPMLSMTTMACISEPGPRDTILDLALADIPDGRHTATRIALHPVEITRRGREVTAVSLLCTHMGCRVRWFPAREAYICPCHDGTFDAEGYPLAGPPTEPLDRLPVVVEGDRVRIGPLPRPEQAA
jgi:nitrite reductase/ring-hydroxylating ferredoxin subunit